MPTGICRRDGDHDDDGGRAGGSERGDALDWQRGDYCDYRGNAGCEDACKDYCGDGAGGSAGSGDGDDAVYSSSSRGGGSTPGK